MSERIIRMFNATIKPGKQREFQEFFLGEALPMIRSQDGLVSVQVGLPLESSPHEFAMVTTWTSLAAVKKFAGTDWEKAVIDPREAPLIDRSSVSHFYEAIE